jgi:ClpP class serine protease
MTEEHQNERDEPLSESEEADFTSKAFRVLWQEGKSENDLRKELSLLLAQQVTFLRAQHNLNDYEVVFVWKDDQGLADDDVTAVYAALPAKQEPKKKVLMLLDSTGGKIEPAYLISKACKRLSQNFCVAIPRKAKSAATLISLGASEIHVGLSSELGPIDPQIGGIPAQALSNSLFSGDVFKILVRAAQFEASRILRAAQ